MIVVFDGYWQFFFEKNTIGFVKYRDDRISGFFKEDLILGSFLSRLLPLYLGLTLYFKKNKNLLIFNFILIVATIILIFLTGERSSFFKTLIFVFIIFFLIDLNYKYKFYIFSSIAISLYVIFSLNSVIFDRYYNQTKNQLLGNNNMGLLSYYTPMFQTSLKMFMDSKLIGKGPKTYRYYCNDEKFITFYPWKVQVDNSIIKLNASWKEIRNFEVIEFFVSEGDKIKKGDKLFSYKFIGGDEKLSFFYSDKDGKVKKILDKAYDDVVKDRYVLNNAVIEVLPPENVPKFSYKDRDGCNTHPHNFYFQLLAETGLIGFLYILSIFSFLSFILIKNFIKINF